MASAGLMSLAYMAETALVFNLAYVELSRGRYIKEPKAEIDALREKIINEPGIALNTSTVAAKDAIVDRLARLTSPIPAERQSAWYVGTGEHGTDSHHQRHYDRLAGRVYRFFDRDKDRTACQHLLLLSAALLVLMTLFERHAVNDLTGSFALAATIFLGSLCFWFVHVVADVMKPVLAKVLLICGAAAFPLAIFASDAGVASFGVDAYWFFFVLYSCAICAPGIFILFGRRLSFVLNEARLDAGRQFETLKARPLEALQSVEVGPKRPSAPR